MKTENIIDKLKTGDVRAVARLLTLIENEEEDAETILKKYGSLPEILTL